MNKYDLEHKLLMGSPLYIGNIPTYKVTLGEMVDNGFTQTQNVISFLCMDDEKAQNMFNNSPKNLTTFLLIASIINEHNIIGSRDFHSAHGSNLLTISILQFLSLFFKKEVNFNQKYGFIIDTESKNPFVLNETNYNDFRTILMERNCLVDLNNFSDENPDTEMTRKLLEKRKKLRDKVRKAKQLNGDDIGLNLADLISIFAEAEHMPLQDVYNKYDIYQFNNQFNRLKIMDDFHVNIQMLLAGAKKENIKFQHWLSKIKEHED